MADDIPRWAKERACELANSENQFVGPFLPRHCDGDEFVSLTALARYIAAHEEPPADPLLIEARALAEKWEPDMVTPLQSARRTSLEAMAQEALKRGMELAGDR